MDSKPTYMERRKKNFENKVNGVKSRVKNNINLKKTQFDNSTAGALIDGTKNVVKAKGFKNKAKAAFGGLKRTHLGRRVSNIKDKMRKLRKKFTAKEFKKKLQLAAIVMGVSGTIIGLMEHGFTLYALAQSAGGTPHYYCTIDVPKELKQSELYQQYCGKKASAKYDENGIPIMISFKQSKGIYDPELDKFIDTEFTQYHWNNMWKVDEGVRKPVLTSSHGCGPTTVAMMLSWIYGEIILPHEIMGNTSYMGTSGSSHDFVKRVCEYRGLGYKEIPMTREAVTAELQDGNFIVLLHHASEVSGPLHYNINSKHGMWTEGGHYTGLIGITDDGQFAVIDPSAATSYCGPKEDSSVRHPNAADDDGLYSWDDISFMCSWARVIVVPDEVKR